MMVAMQRRVVRASVVVWLCALASVSVAGDVVGCWVEDTIQPASQRFIERALAEAELRGAEVTIIELNTPGGLLTSLRQMTSAITQPGARS